MKKRIGALRNRSEARTARCQHEPAEHGQERSQLFGPRGVDAQILPYQRTRLLRRGAEEACDWSEVRTASRL